ncbi:MAG TPA: hypothetical protein VIL72_12835 [Beijerinckiaceae bacterium]|jgi:hypothetical protein
MTHAPSLRRAVLCLALFAAAPLAAQTPAPQGPASPPATSPAEVPLEANAVVPYAGAAGQSAAPTMVRDCQKAPQDCDEPLTNAERARAKENVEQSVR